MRPSAQRQQSNAAAALKNLAIDDVDNQEAIRVAGGIAPLLRIAERGADRGARDADPQSVRATAAACAALHYIAVDNIQNKDSIRRLNGIEVLVRLLRCGDAETEANAAGAIANAACGNAANRAAVRSCGGIETLVQMIEPLRSRDADTTTATAV